MKKGIGRSIISIMLIITMLLGLLPTGMVLCAQNEYDAYENSKVGIISDPEGWVNVRSTPTTSTNSNLTGYVLDYMERVEVLGEAKDLVNDYIWYYVRFVKDSVTVNGFVRGDLIRVIENANPEDLEGIYNELIELGFPESYARPLAKLKIAHPQWTFIPYDTNLSWDTMLAQQNVSRRKLVDNDDPASWKSIEKGYFNYKTNSWVIMEGNTRVQASSDIIAYYMDPRNFFTDGQIFQFEILDYNPLVHTEEAVEKALADTFMGGVVIGEEAKGESAELTYAKALIGIAASAHISPFYLIGKIISEQGRSGTSPLISGTYPGYEGYYNFYNIGATGVGNTEIIVNGLTYAKEHGWDTRYKALFAGANSTISDYIERGQNTLYLQDWDAVDIAKGSWPRQYAQYVWDAELNASMTASDTYYKLGLQDSPFVFSIPIYSNMPSEAVTKPTDDRNPNFKLGNITVDGYNFTPSFDTDVTQYSLIVPTNVSSINITATPYASTTTVEGAGVRQLAEGDNVIEIVSTAQNGTKRSYYLNITRSISIENNLSYLELDGLSLSPAFSPNVYEYTAKADYSKSSVVIKASAQDGYIIEGAGEKSLNIGENRFVINVSSPDSETVTSYNITITRTNEATYTLGNLKVKDDYIYGLNPSSTVMNLRNELIVQNGDLVIYNSKSEAVTDDSLVLGTGYRVEVVDKSGTVKFSKLLVIYGDFNSDGKISLLDYAFFKKHLWKDPEFTGVYLEAADVSHDGKATLFDYAILKKYMWKEIDIAQTY